MSTTPTTPIAAPSLAHLTQAFEAWESRYRTCPSTFMSPAEVAAMEVATVSEARAIYFAALLREVQAGTATDTAAPATGAAVDNDTAA